MTNCNDKRAYKTLAEAEAVVRGLRKDKRKAGGGHGLRLLNAYYCEAHQCWHVGRSSLKKQKPASAKRIPTMGELRRRLRRIEERMDREKWHRAFLLGQIIERDRQRYEAEGL